MDGEKVYVLVAYYSDKSAFTLLGVYESNVEAMDRLDACLAADTSMVVDIVEMIIGRVSDEPWRI